MKYAGAYCGSCCGLRARFDVVAIARRLVLVRPRPYNQPAHTRTVAHTVIALVIITRTWNIHILICVLLL